VRGDGEESFGDRLEESFEDDVDESSADVVQSF
jgi:hypothetical protein